MVRRHGVRVRVPARVLVVAVSALILWGVGTGAVGTAAATANEAPLADAGLDQTVGRNATVYLDATGSRDPDGAIDSYEWTIESPAGAEFEPDCADCPRTQFVVTTTGVYNATVEVTDEDGATRSDTLRVTVEAVEPPTVRLTGPDELTVGVVGQFDAGAAAGDASLATLEWIVNGTRVDSERLNGYSDNATLSHAFESPGERTVRARVVDRLGRVRTAPVNVTVTLPSDLALAAGNGGSADSECSRTDMPRPDPCEDSAHFDASDETVVLIDGDNDGVYTFDGRAVLDIEVDGRMTDVIRVDQSMIEEMYDKTYERNSAGGLGNNNGHSSNSGGSTETNQDRESDTSGGNSGAGEINHQL